jgi:hypothetical protein
MKKKLGTWPTISATSQKLRRETESMLTQLTTSADTDTISAAAVVAKELSAWKALVQEARGVLEPLAARTQEALTAAADSFTDDLKSALSLGGVSVYGDGNLLIADGIVYIQTNATSASIRINGQEHGSFHVPGIVAQVQDRITELATNSTAPLDLLGQLHVAYDLARQLQGEEYGNQLQTTSLLPFLAFLRQRAAFRNNPVKEQFQSYSFDQFRADLYTLIRAGNLEVDSEIFHYASGSDTKGSVFMLVPTLGRPAHIGRIWFERAKA